MTGPSDSSVELVWLAFDITVNYKEQVSLMHAGVCRSIIHLAKATVKYNNTNIDMPIGIVSTVLT